MENALTDSQKFDLILARLDSIDTRLDKVDTRIEEVRLNLSTRIDDLGAQMTAMEIKMLDKIGSLYDLNDRTEKRVTLIEQRLGVIDARLSGIDDRLSNHANLEKKFNQLDDRLHALERKIA